MLRIGLTGGLGSGKSTVAHIFEVIGVPVYYADVASKKLMNENARVKASVQNAFGNDIYPDGKLNTKYLAEIVFKDENKLALLNSIVHPATLQDMDEWMTKQNTPYAIKEAALIFESRSNKSLDYVIGIKAPFDMRLQRAINRDGISKDDALARINKQMNEDDKIGMCDFVILNNEIEMIIPQVLDLHNKLLRMAGVV